LLGLGIRWFGNPEFGGFEVAAISGSPERSFLSVI
jgi:hypothetical protein